MLARFLIASLVMAGLLASAAAGPDSPSTPSASDEQVKIEVKFISIAEDFFDRIGVDPKPNPGTTVFLDEKQKRQFLQAVEGDIRSNILQAPWMIVSNGKTAIFRCTDRLHFVTGMKAIRQGEHVVLCPKNETISTGLKLSTQPKIGADRRTIAVNLKTTLTSLDPDKVPLFPIIGPVAASAESGVAGRPAQVTQYIQQPRITTLAMQEELIIPEGRTVVVGGWKRLSEGRMEYGPPPSPISKIPYLNRLFTNERYTRSVEHILVMVTATIVHDEKKEAACPKKKVADQSAANR